MRLNENKVILFKLCFTYTTHKTLTLARIVSYWASSFCFRAFSLAWFRWKPFHTWQCQHTVSWLSNFFVSGFGLEGLEWNYVCIFLWARNCLPTLQLDGELFVLFSKFVVATTVHRSANFWLLQVDNRMWAINELRQSSGSPIDCQFQYVVGWLAGVVCPESSYPRVLLARLEHVLPQCRLNVLREMSAQLIGQGHTICCHSNGSVVKNNRVIGVYEAVVVAEDFIDKSSADRFLNSALTLHVVIEVVTEMLRA